MPKGDSTLKGTPINSIPEIVEKCREKFETGITMPLQWRKDQLKHMHDMLTENKEAICEAMMLDLGKNRYDSTLTEIMFVCNEIAEAIGHLDKWAKPQALSQSFPYSMETVYTKYEPFGVVLNISPWNYPFHLTFAPMVGIIAAGNACVIKPSEVSWNCGKLMAEMVPKYMDKDLFPVISGGVAETTKLLEQRFDHILYTGNGMVAKIVAAAAAKYLTPCTLELGGKSPVYVDKDTDLWITARRVSLGKWSNAGQTCVAPDYIMVHKDVADGFLEQMKKVAQEFYGDDVKTSPDYSRVININHFRRLKKLLDNTKGEVVLGGQIDEADLFIAPTVVANVKDGDSLMDGEIFGPILPVMVVDGVADAIKYVAAHDHPLAAYAFTNNKQIAQQWIDKVHSGGMCINDTVTHLAVAAPFGGVGPSGCGYYHSVYGFRQFSHPKTVMHRAQAMEKMNEIRSPPWSERKWSWLEWLAGKKVSHTPKTPRGGSA